MHCSKRMSARIYLKHNDKHFRFLRFVQEGDGSLYVFVVRDREQRRGAMKWDQDQLEFVPNPEPADGPRRISYHTSGRVNYRPVVSSPPRFFEPLFDVTRRNHFFFVSIPSVLQLDPVPELPRPGGTISQGILVIPPSVTGRLCFQIIVAPSDDQGRDMATYLRLGYDTFSVFIELIALPFSIPDSMENHFLYGASSGLRDAQFCGRFEAELAYHKSRTGEADMIVYGPDNQGVYTLYASVVMRIKPKLRIEFAKPDLRVEVVDGSRANRIRFRIRGKGGYVTEPDLRPLIQSIELDAEL